MTNSLYTNQLQQSLNIYGKIKLAFFDIDSTLSGPPGTADKNLIDQLLQLLDKKNYFYLIASSRTEEMLMTSDQYHISKEKYGFSRPPPQFKLTDGQFTNQPEKIDPANLFNPEIIISSTGAKIFFKQNAGGYLEDKGFYHPNLPTAAVWRQQVTALIDKINQKKPLGQYHALEFPESYRQKKVDVFPPDYRIELRFKNVDDLMLFKSEFEKVNELPSPLYLVNDSSPIKNKYALYVMPKNGKTDAVNYLQKKITHDFNILSTQLEILYVGDSCPDLLASLYGGQNLHPDSTLLLVNGSRLASYLTQDNLDDFAGENLTDIKKHLLLKDKKGYYQFTQPPFERQVVIGDLAFPDKPRAESVISYLL